MIRHFITSHIEHYSIFCYNINRKIHAEPNPLYPRAIIPRGFGFAEHGGDKASARTKRQNIARERRGKARSKIPRPSAPLGLYAGFILAGVPRFAAKVFCPNRTEEYRVLRIK